LYDYNTTPTPPFGQDANNPPYAHDGYEDLINSVSQLGATASGFVFRGLPTTNMWFTPSNVYACAQTWQIGGHNAEASYVEIPSAPIPGVAAHKVQGTNYLRLNSFVRLNPTGYPDWHYYDFYVAPTADEVSPPGTLGTPGLSGSGLNTIGTVQYFYQDLNALPFGKNAIVRLVSSGDPLIAALTIPAAGVASSVPIFGALYQRWADETDNALQLPWEGPMGYPVQPPILLNNGELRANAKGAFRLFGQYFEKGFIYWYHYVTPDTPDDTLAYHYTGTNVFAGDGKYVASDNGTVSYGAGGRLGVTCIASNVIRKKDSKGDVMASIGDFVTFRAFAYGGLGPTHYTDMIWNFRDGTVDWDTGGTGNYNSMRVTGHAYIQEGVYKVRGMVIQDNAANFYLGTNVAMGDTALVRAGVVGTQVPGTKVAIIRGFPATAPAGVTDADINPIAADLATEGWSNTGDVTILDAVPASSSALSQYRGVFWVFCGQNIMQNAWPGLSTAAQNVMRAYLNEANRHNVIVVGSTVLGTLYNPGWWTGSGYLYWDTDFYENYIGISARAGIMLGYFPTGSYMSGGVLNSWPPYVGMGTYLLRVGLFRRAEAGHAERAERVRVRPRPVAASAAEGELALRHLRQARPRFA
jgi:hypothetical protein